MILEGRKMIKLYYSIQMECLIKTECWHMMILILLCITCHIGLRQAMASAYGKMNLIR